MDTISDRAHARGLPRDIESIILERKVETTSMREFVDDDEGYLQWVNAIPNGYVINAPKRRGDFPDMLHRASCTFIKTRQRTNYTTTDFMKICSLDKQALIDWGTKNSDDFRKCKHCKP
jgi:hypothetical protein